MLNPRWTVLSLRTVLSAAIHALAGPVKSFEGEDTALLPAGERSWAGQGGASGLMYSQN